MVAVILICMACMQISFGIHRVVQQVAALQVVGFDNQLTDTQTKWQYLGKGYRAYDPALHRFMAQDSMSPFDKGGLNGYVFSHNNPVMSFDPSGHFNQDLAFQIGGVALGLVGSVLSTGLLGVGGASTWLSLFSDLTAIGSIGTGVASMSRSSQYHDEANLNRARTLAYISTGLGVASALSAVLAGFIAPTVIKPQIGKLASRATNTNDVFASSGRLAEQRTWAHVLGVDTLSEYKPTFGRRLKNIFLGGDNIRIFPKEIVNSFYARLFFVPAVTFGDSIGALMGDSIGALMGWGVGGDPMIGAANHSPSSPGKNTDRPTLAASPYDSVYFFNRPIMQEFRGSEPPA